MIDFPSNPTNGQVYANYIYDSSITAWRNVNTDTGIGTLNAMGLKNVVPTNVGLASGSATTNSNGLVTFSGASAISINGVFTSTYRNYKIVYSQVGTAAATMLLRFNVSNGTNTTNNYSSANITKTRSSATLSGQNGQDISYIYIGSTYVYHGGATLEVQNPAVSDKWTNVELMASDNYELGLCFGAGMYTQSAAFDGFNISAASGTISGTIQVFGYTQ